MNRKDLYKGFHEVDDDILERSETAARSSKKPAWLKWGAVAACLAVVVVAGALTIPRLLSEDSTQITIGGVAREYKDVSIFQAETAIVWPWEYQTIFEQYRTVFFHDKKYAAKTLGMTVDASWLGDSIGSCEAVGYDDYTGREYRQTFEVRPINSISEDLMVAVGMDGDFYVFQYDEYDPPETFGEALDGYSLPQTLRFDRFQVYKDGKGEGYYSLQEDDRIWAVLSGCRDARFIEDDAWSVSGRDYISFTATSEALGVYKRVFYVTSDGFVSTNIFDWGYIFDIGEEAASEIIAYATENAMEAEPEPYTNSLAGTLVEIGEGYILVDDSILCADPNDGMVFQVPTADVRISRCIDFLNIGTGDVVSVSFTGDIDVETGNSVTGAYAMTEAVISNGDVFIPE